MTTIRTGWVLALLAAVALAVPAAAELHWVRYYLMAYNQPTGEGLSLDLKAEGSGKFPEFIQRLRVVAPDGTAFDTVASGQNTAGPYTFDNYSFHDSIGFWAPASSFLSGVVPSGLYRIVVRDDFGDQDAFLVRLTVKPMPLPANLFPGQGQTVSLPAVFSWDPVPGAQRYRVRISNANMGYPPIYEAQTYNTSLQIPDWVLFSGRTYQWRLDVDESPTNIARNRSTSAYTRFSVQ